MSQTATAEHDWPKARFRHLADVRKGILPPSGIKPRPELEVLPYLTMEYLRGDGSDPILVPVDPSMLVAPADSILLLWDGANAGEFLRAKRGVVSSTSALVVPRDVDHGFFYWACKSQEDRIRAETIGMGIPHVNGDSLANTAFRLPPPPRQRAIADYLDREAAWIDALVEAKENILELLAEKRKILVLRTVTRGIKPNVSPRTSGVSWLGEIPEHWRMGRLKNFGSLLSGTGFPHEFQGVEGETLPFYKVGDLATRGNDRYMGRPSNTISFETAVKLRVHVVPKGAIVYAKIGAALLLNRRRITTVPCAIDNNMTAYVPREENLISRWAFYWTSILDFGIFANPGAVPSLSEGDQAQLPIAIPPVAEQRAIADYLDRETVRLDALAARIERTIALLKERRAALIAAAVTGRIDVESAA